MRRSSGFTSIEAIVVTVSVLLLVVVMIAFFLPSYSGRDRGRGNRTICASRLAGVYKALNTYSVDNGNKFPIYSSTATGSARAFRYTARSDVTYSPAVEAELKDSVTAPFWAVVRDGSTSPKNFLCPSDFVTNEDTLEVASTGSPVTDVRMTWDFNLVGPSHAPSLSYSVMDMYDPNVAANWSPNAGADWVFAGDDNSNDSTGTPARHSLSRGATVEDIKAAENSTVHRSEGQNLMYGDGHVNFTADPFDGPGHDNVFARGSARFNAAPTLHHNDAVDKNDVVLLPITGNGGVNLVNSR